MRRVTTNLVALAVALLAIFAVTADAADWRTYHANTQGFAISLPSTWVSVSTLDQAALDVLSKEAGFASIANSASTSTDISVFTSDKTAFMDAGAYRATFTTLDQVSADAAKTLRASSNTAQVTASTVVLPAGRAALITYLLGSGTAQVKASEYIFFRDSIVHVINFAAPVAKWKGYSSTFHESAQTFEYEKGQDVSALVLTGSDVGKGFKRKPFPGGTSVIGETTLDLCNQNFPSEGLRTSRMQVHYAYGSGFPISNEVVAYAAGGATQALNEVKTAATACSAATITRIQGSNRVSFHTTPITVSGLPAGSVAVQLHVVVESAGKTVTEDGVAIYMVRGNILSGIYAYTAPGLPIAKLTSIAIHAAQRSAQKLGGLTLAA
jgi:hypothetical protein